MRSVDNTRATSTLVRGRWVFTGATDPDTTLDEGAVLIEGGFVRETGAWRALRERYPEARVLGSDRYAVLPGFINAHHQSYGVSTIQHGIRDQALEPWAFSLARKRSADVYLSTLLSAGAMLRSGVTSVLESFCGEGRASQYSTHVRRGLEAYAQSGMRAVFAAGFKTSGFLISGVGEDRRFIESLPPELQALALTKIPEADAMEEDEYFSVMDELRQRYERHSRVDLWFGPPGPQWVSDAYLQRAAAFAEEWNVGIQTEVDESLRAMSHGQQFYGAPTMTHLERLEVLSPRFSIAHGVWLNAAQMEVCARNGVSVSHNPSANLRHSSGVAPVNAMIGRDVNVALGTGGATLNDDDDMFTELRLAHRLRCDPSLPSASPTIKQSWELATVGGAILLGRGGVLGRLAPGCAADVVLVDLERITAPWIAPEIDPLELVLSRARAGDVDTVMVSGDIVFEHGYPTRFDEREAAEALADGLAETPYASAAAEVIDELLPSIVRWYEARDEPKLDPWQALNSK